VKKALNAKNLEALGAERLAELLIEIGAGDAAAKRRLRLELAGAESPAEAAREIRKRLSAITRWQWHLSLLKVSRAGVISLLWWRASKDWNAMAFSHPLARGAKVWPAVLLDGKTQHFLVIVTTIELDPNSKRYHEEMVERLSQAAQDYLDDSSEADGFILMNRLRDWDRNPDPMA